MKKKKTNISSESMEFKALLDIFVDNESEQRPIGHENHGWVVGYEIFLQVIFNSNCVILG